MDNVGNMVGKFGHRTLHYSIYNIIVPFIGFPCYFIPKIIEETFYSLRRDSTVCFTEHAATFNSHACSKNISKEYVVPLFMTDEEFKAYKNVMWKSLRLRNLKIRWDSFCVISLNQMIWFRQTERTPPPIHRISAFFLVFMLS